MLGKAVAVGAVCKWYVQHPSIGHGLLQTIRNTAGIVFCFHNSDGIIRAEIQDIVRPFWLFTEYKVAFQIDFTIRNTGFHGDFFSIPLGKESRGNIL